MVCCFDNELMRTSERQIGTHAAAALLIAINTVA